MSAIILILTSIVLIDAICGYGLGVMISASQADDSGSIPGSRTIFSYSIQNVNE